MRYMEAQGYQVGRVTLKYGWPPPRAPGSTVDEAGIKVLAERLDEQKPAEVKLLTKEIDKIFPRLNIDKEQTESADHSRHPKFCVVLSQGTANAQGGDVFVLLVDKDRNEAVLQAIQCKNYKAKPNKETIRQGWASVGVRMEIDSGHAELNPTEGSAGYSYAGLLALADVMTKVAGRSVCIGDRILALSTSMLGGGGVGGTFETFPLPNDESCRVWFREMLEPTISVLPPSTSTSHHFEAP
jgi:hypothetical protein